MNIQTLNKIWTVVATTSFYFMINIFIITQGGHFLFPGLKLEEINPRSAAIYGTFFAVPVYLLALYLTLKFIYKKEAESGLEKLPIAFDIQLDFNDNLASKYQIFFFISYLVLPLYASGHFINKTLNGFVYDKVTSTIIAESPTEHLFNYMPFFEILTSGNQYRFQCEITYFPFWQTWLGIILTIICLILFIKIIYNILK